MGDHERCYACDESSTETTQDDGPPPTGKASWRVPLITVVTALAVGLGSVLVYRAWWSSPPPIARLNSLPVDARDAGQVRIPSAWFEGEAGLTRAEGLQSHTLAPIFVLTTTTNCSPCDELEHHLEALLGEGRTIAFAIKCRLVVGIDGGASTRLGNLTPARLVVLPGGGVTAMTVELTGTGLDDVSSALRSALATGSQELVVSAYELRRQDQRGAALANLNRALALDPANPDGWYWRGVLRSDSRQVDAAIEDLQQAITLRRDHAEALELLGFLLLGEERHREALPHLDRLVELRPRDGRAYYLRGGARLRLGNATGAHADAALACQLGDPNGCRAQSHLEPHE